MIYSGYKGGLGNCLFQHAAMLSFAHDNNDTVGFINLDSNIRYLNSETNFNPALNHAHEYSFLFEKNNVAEPGNYTNRFNSPFHFEPLTYVEGAFYDGFYQSEKYFGHNRQLILDNITPTEGILTYIRDHYKDLLRLDNTVTIHVRRNDYVRNQAYHAVLPIDYYKNAINNFDIKSNFIIFSDDIEWCKQNFDFLENKYFIESEKDYIELFLMSMFNDNIIANSSFSWWGAWLNKNRDKKVIGPSTWFGPMYASWNTSDIIPESWIKI